MKTMKKLMMITIFFALSYSVSAQKEGKEMVAEKKTTEVMSIETINAIPKEMLAENVKNAKKISNPTGSPQADGIVYDIISSKNVTLNACFSCGPAVGHESSCLSKFTIETRKYAEWKKGKVVRVWMSDVQSFMGCGSW